MVVIKNLYQEILVNFIFSSSNQIDHDYNYPAYCSVYKESPQEPGYNCEAIKRQRRMEKHAVVIARGTIFLPINTAIRN